jgi:hypothetical protein
MNIDQRTIDQMTNVPDLAEAGSSASFDRLIASYFDRWSFDRLIDAPAPARALARQEP